MPMAFQVSVTQSGSALIVAAAEDDFSAQEIYFADSPAELTDTLVRLFARHLDAGGAREIVERFMQSLACHHPRAGIPLDGGGAYR
jgi:hypothetical protein